MNDEHVSNETAIIEYDALISSLARAIDLGGGLAAALDIASYVAVRSRVAGIIDVPAGLQAALDTVRSTQVIDRSIDTNYIRTVSRDQPIFGILGRTTIRIDGAVHADWGTSRLRAMLAVLLLHAGRPMSVASLIEWIWPDGGSGPRHALSTLHTYAARLRQSLQRADTAATLTVANDTYRLDVDRSAIDYYRAKMLLADARKLQMQGQSQQSASLALETVQMWRGRPLAELPSSRADTWRHQAEVDDWIPANVVLLETLLELGAFSDVLDRSKNLQVAHPNDLAFIKSHLAALRGLGRYSEATAYYLNMRRRLMFESNERAAEQLRQFHSSLNEVKFLSDMSVPRSMNIVPRQLPPDIAGFADRDGSMHAITEAAAAAMGSSKPGVIVLDGVAGVGKTALAVHWAHSNRVKFPDGAFFVNLHGFPEATKVSDPAIVDNLLSALGHLRGNDQTQRSKELTLSRLPANRRTLVILDNAQDSMQILDLVQMLTSSLVIVTSRQRLTTLIVATEAHAVRIEPVIANEPTTLLRPR